MTGTGLAFVRRVRSVVPGVTSNGSRADRPQSRPLHCLRCNEETSFPARRPSAGAVPGRWGACLAVRTPPAAFRLLALPGRLQPQEQFLEVVARAERVEVG